MRTITSMLVLALAAAPAFAESNLLPEPESLALFAIGAVGMLLAHRRKK